ncbi:MAG: TatD family hydrolase [Patescibacteria group bacterium]
MKCKYFDAHTHIHFPAFDKDRNEVAVRAIDQGVGMVTVGTGQTTSKKAVEIAHAFMNIWAAVGLHPIHTADSHHDADESGKVAQEGAKAPAEKFDHAFYKTLGEDARVVAIGECGLDYYRLEGSAEKAKKTQREGLVAQIALAHEVKKPLMIHCRSAFPDLIEILEAQKKYLAKNDAGVIHFFSGTPAEAEQLLSLGFSFTFGGVITFTRDYDAVIKMLPMDRILSETDAPYVAPAPYRGKRNQPVYIVEVVKKLAELRGVSESDMAAQTIANAERIFKIQLS